MKIDDLKNNLAMPSTGDIIAGMRQRYGVADSQKLALKSFPIEVLTKDTDLDADGYTFAATITADSLDADNEVVLPQGMNSTRFERGGTIFWNHRYDLPPVAAPIGKLQRSNDRIRAVARFPKRPADYVGEFFPDLVRALVFQGAIRGVSIGFIPEAVREPSRADIEKYGPTVRTVITRWQLLEWSVAPLQSNPDAIITAAKSLGILDDEGHLNPEPKKKTYIIAPDDAPKPVKKYAYYIDAGTPKASESTEAKVKRIAEQMLAKKRGRVCWRPEGVH